MPTYEYICRACGHNFEIYQLFTDDTLTICPSCGGELRKVFGAPTITFKGSGFYATDNRKGAKSGGEKKPEGTKEPSTTGDKGSSKDAKAGSRESSGSSESSGSKPAEKKSDGSKKEASKP